MCLSSGAKEERIVRCSAHAACAALSPEPGSLVYHTHAYVLSHLSRVCFFATPWTVARQAPLSLGFSRQEHWSGLPFPSPRDLAGPGVKAASHMSPALADGFFTTSATWEAQHSQINTCGKDKMVLWSRMPRSVGGDAGLALKAVG